MATLFRDFSFEAASRHTSTLEAERAAMNISPTTTPFTAPPPSEPARLPTPPPCTIGELARRFNQQTLRVNTNCSYWIPTFSDPPLTPPHDNTAFPTQQSAYASLSPVDLRLQRQANTRMQCSSTHIKDISILVQRMIEDGDQCNVCDPSSLSSSRPSSLSSASSNEDEGVDMAYSPKGCDDLPLSPLKFRRSGDRLVGQAMVSRSVRMRRKNKVTKRSSK